MSGEKPLVDDLAWVLASTVVGWEPIIGADLAEAPEVKRVLARYRQDRDLLANGQRVEWCEEHNSIELNGSTCMAWEQAYSATAESWEVEIDCRIVSKILVAVDEEERDA